MDFIMARMNTSLKALHRSEKKRNNISSLIKGVAVALALIATPLTYHYVSSRPDIFSSLVTLSDARRDSSVRQRFLNTLVKKDEIPGCAGIVYDHEGTQIIEYINQQIAIAQRLTNLKDSPESIGENLDSFKGGNYDVKTPEILQLSGQGRTVPIFVGKQFFESKEFSYLSAPEMKAVLVFHEGEHVRQHRDGFPYLSKEEIQDSLEHKTLDPLVLYESYEYDARIREVPRVLSSPSLGWYFKEDVKARFLASGFYLTKSSKGASPQQQRLVEQLHSVVGKNPLLRDVPIDSRYFKARAELMK